MVYDIYYLIYGIKLDDKLLKRLVDYVVECGECDLELIEESCRNDGWEWNEIKNTDKKYLYVDNEYLENFLFEDLESFYNGDMRCGEVIWCSENLNAFELEQATELTLPKLEASKSTRKKAEEMVNSFKERLPDDLQHLLPPIGFYWCVGSSY